MYFRSRTALSTKKKKETNFIVIFIRLFIPLLLFVVVVVVIVIRSGFFLQFQISAVNETEEGHKLHSLTVDSLVQYVKDGVRK